MEQNKNTRGNFCTTSSLFKPVSNNLEAHPNNQKETAPKPELEYSFSLSPLNQPNVPQPEAAINLQGKEAISFFLENFLHQKSQNPLPGYFALWTLEDKRTYAFTPESRNEIIHLCFNLRDSKSVYFGVCLQKDKPDDRGRGSAEGAKVMFGLWMDVDIVGEGHKGIGYPATKDEALEFLNRQELKPTMIVHSGGGLHVYYLFDEPWIFEDEVDNKLARELSKAFQTRLQDSARAKGWKIDSTHDLARILRVPGTFNHKNPPPKEVRIVAYQPDNRYDHYDLIQMFATVQPQKQTSSLPVLVSSTKVTSEEYPPADAEMIRKHCPWFDHTYTDSSSLPEPEWFPLLSILAKCIDGNRLAHEFSQNYPNYSYQETERKLAHASKYGPRTCENIESTLHGTSYCTQCEFKGFIKSPIVLGNATPANQALITVAVGLKKAIIQPGFPFSSEYLEALATLKRLSPKKYARITADLKVAKIPIKKLEDAVKAQLVEYDNSYGDPLYAVKDGQLVLKKYTAHGETSVPLANFDARIVAQITRDDGIDKTRSLVIEVEMANGNKLEEAEVPADEFANMNWVMNKFGADPTIAAGPIMKDHLRAAIQTLSTDKEYQYVYTHTGWRKVDDDWLFLTMAGGLSKDGLIQNVTVDLGVGKLNNYDVSAPPDGIELSDCIQASMKVASVLPERLGYPVFLLPYLSAFCEILELDFSVFLAGSTGVMKTAVAAIAQAHEGKGFNERNLPGNWISTGNALEKSAYLAKDMIFVVDDFVPGAAQDANATHRLADRLLRGQGNRAGRARMNRDRSLQAEYFPRGLIVSTGEEVPRGSSLRGRMLILEINKGDVDTSILTELQKYATQGALMGAKSGFVRWLAPKMDELKQTLPSQKNERRNEIRQSSRGHSRTSGILACLMVTLDLFCEYATEVRCLTDEEAANFRKEGCKHILDTGRDQDEVQNEEKSSRRFLELLNAVLLSEEAHLASFTDDVPPPNPTRWGWREITVGTGDNERTDWRAGGEKIGWVKGNDIYLEFDAAYAAVQKIAKTQGNAFNISPKPLRQLLDDDKHIASKEGKNLVVRKTINGQMRRVVHILATTLDFDDAVQSDEATPVQYDEIFGILPPPPPAPAFFIGESVPAAPPVHVAMPIPVDMSMLGVNEETIEEPAKDLEPHGNPIPFDLGLAPWEEEAEVADSSDNPFGHPF